MSSTFVAGMMRVLDDHEQHAISLTDTRRTQDLKRKSGLFDKLKLPKGDKTINGIKKWYSDGDAHAAQKRRFENEAEANRLKTLILRLIGHPDAKAILSTLKPIDDKVKATRLPKKRTLSTKRVDMRTSPKANEFDDNEVETAPVANTFTKGKPVKRNTASIATPPATLTKFEQKRNANIANNDVLLGGINPPASTLKTLTRRRKAVAPRPKTRSSPRSAKKQKTEGDMMYSGGDSGEDSMSISTPPDLAELTLVAQRLRLLVQKWVLLRNLRCQFTTVSSLHSLPIPQLIEIPRLCSASPGTLQWRCCS
jgi:hypothetical protein